MLRFYLFSCCCEWRELTLLLAPGNNPSSISHFLFLFYRQQYNQVQVKTRENSVAIKNSWKVVEGGEIDFTQLAKLSLPLERKPETL